MCSRLSVSICKFYLLFFFFFSSRRRHTRCSRDWSSDVCSSDLGNTMGQKTHPYGFRLGFNKPFKSRWYADKEYAHFPDIFVQQGGVFLVGVPARLERLVLAEPESLRMGFLSPCVFLMPPTRPTTSFPSFAA